jgi:polyisoprenoid-binding protein YceI
MLTSGKDFEDAYKYREIFFKTRFTGCTGVLSFDGTTNDRSPMDYDITNA